ncbi:aspartate aminotransferase family protein [Mycolicibacterium sp. HK-90]|uniref:aspartate aminotransferase family protein n=1 Tax=Mycolicibacterium sp. HK-90 TaxID=3056937 RepID=UPI00265AFBFE|nr:aminotransferase class III-fold pyridoxal phosphate-dependent enzyme [Mycolicibacterium sp. HK-90]WKG06828.1 aminotransferase class III-fold pyridoxal phosphate-dependent enzyme [Mycolicibacterium sp. HK-90]
MVNGFDQSRINELEPAMQAIVRRRTNTLGPAYKLFYNSPLEIVRGEGVHLYDKSGNAYLDVYNNVPSVGHCHPHVVAAVTEQLATLNTHTRYAGEAILDYSDRLLATFPDELSNVMYTCTGSEANDLALRVARHRTKARGIIVTEYAYHGTTASIVDISTTMGPNVPIGIDVRTVPAPIPTPDGRDVGEVFARNVRAAIDDLERHGIGFAALIVDTIFSTDGVLTEPAGFLKAAVDVVHAAGGLFIADEVQPGFARTGRHWWGFARHDVLPDLVVMGKPMGNGLPIAAMVARPDVLAEFGEQTRYFNTFGGNSVCIAAANAVLDVIENEGLMANCAEVGDYLLDGLRHIADSDDRLHGARGAGLFLGLDFVDADGAPDPQLALAVVNGLRERRVLIGATGKDANSLKIRPPLPFTKENADTFLEAFGGAVGATR